MPDLPPLGPISHYPLDLFLYQVDLKKYELTNGLSPNEDGRYSVLDGRLEQTIIEIIELYREYLSSNDRISTFEEMESKILNFSNITTVFQMKKFVDLYIQNSYEDRWIKTVKNIAYPKLTVTFENCFFPDLGLEHHINRRIFAKFYLKKCHAVFAHIGGGFAGMFKKIEVNESFFNSLRISEMQSDVQFLETTFPKFYAASCTFSKINFTRCSFGLPAETYIKTANTTFNNARFSGTTEFLECRFFGSPKFHQAEFHSDTSFHLSRFYDVKSPESMGDYRALKQAMESLGAEHDFMNFHALEMEARRNVVLPKLSQVWHHEWAATLSSWFLKITNDYGRNYWLPFIWLLILSFVFSFIYYKFGFIACDYYNIDDEELWQRAMCNIDAPQKFHIALTYALQKSLGPVSLLIDTGALDPVTGTAKIVTVVQVLLSTIYWYIWIVQIRRQFRL